jgi:hypothetical protein
MYLVTCIYGDSSFKVLRSSLLQKVHNFYKENVDVIFKLEDAEYFCKVTERHWM